MINFKEILEHLPKDEHSKIVTVNGHPVWDYKSAGFVVYLIAEDPWQGVEEEYVTVEELKNYLVEIGIPFESADFATEADKEKLTVVSYENNTVTFNHF